MRVVEFYCQGYEYTLCQPVTDTINNWACIDCIWYRQNRKWLIWRLKQQRKLCGACTYSSFTHLFCFSDQSVLITWNITKKSTFTCGGSARGRARCLSYRREKMGQLHVWLCEGSARTESTDLTSSCWFSTVWFKRLIPSLYSLFPGWNWTMWAEPVTDLMNHSVQSALLHAIPLLFCKPSIV